MKVKRVLRIRFNFNLNVAIVRLSRNRIGGEYSGNNLRQHLVSVGVSASSGIKNTELKRNSQWPNCSRFSSLGFRHNKRQLKVEFICWLVGLENDAQKKSACSLTLFITYSN